MKTELLGRPWGWFAAIAALAAWPAFADTNRYEGSLAALVDAKQALDAAALDSPGC